MQFQMNSGLTLAQTDQKRKDAIASVNNVTTGLLDTVNTGVSHVFSNQRGLEHETRVLQQQTQRFSKQTNQWLNLIENFNTSLKVLQGI
jgi:hypothetical protein